jgi:hypothetical protein
VGWIRGKKMVEKNQFVGKNMTKAYNTNYPKIISLILKMSDDQRSMLLEKARGLSNKRKTERLPCLIPAGFYINGNSYNGFLLDVNESGAFIDTNEGYPVGQTLRVEYFDPFKLKGCKYIAEVAWSGTFAIGVKFIENFGNSL